MKKVDVLGTEYTIIIDDFDCAELKGKNRAGYCFFDAGEIHIEDLDADEDWKAETDTVRRRRRNIILRHEIIHAFLFESGLCANTGESNAWAINEEMVDWMALQFPKLLAAFQEADCL